MAASHHCPECGEKPEEAIWALMSRREDDGKERICKIVMRCANHHVPYWQWADRPNDPVEAAPDWASHFDRDPN